MIPKIITNIKIKNVENKMIKCTTPKNIFNTKMILIVRINCSLWQFVFLLEDGKRLWISVKIHKDKKHKKICRLYQVYKNQTCMPIFVSNDSPNKRNETYLKT